MPVSRGSLRLCSWQYRTKSDAVREICWQERGKDGISQDYRHCNAVLFINLNNGNLQTSDLKWYSPDVLRREASMHVFTRLFRLLHTLILSMPASIRSWSTSFCAWTTLLLLLHIFPDISFSVKAQQTRPTIFTSYSSSTPKGAVGKWCVSPNPESQLRLWSRVWSEKLSFLTWAPFLFTVGASSKALWYKRS